MDGRPFVFSFRKGLAVQPAIHPATQQLWETEGCMMLKKRIYLPEKCLGWKCPHFRGLRDFCKVCPTYKEDLDERIAKLTEAHRKAARKYYHKNKQKKVKR